VNRGVPSSLITLGFVPIPGILLLVFLVQPFPVRQLADPARLSPPSSFFVWYTCASSFVVLLPCLPAKNTHHSLTA
jgi:hypothetical protein